MTLYNYIRQITMTNENFQVLNTNHDFILEVIFLDCEADETLEESKQML